MSGVTSRFPSSVQAPPPWSTWWFRLEPLGPQHNERDHHAWMSSIDHIRSTPGFATGEWGDDDWPQPMSLERNLHDLEEHAAEFAAGTAFAYSVLSVTTNDVIGCAYVDPDETGAADAKVRCWMRASHASDDVLFAAAFAGWLRKEWPFTRVRFPGRPRLDFG